MKSVKLNKWDKECLVGELIKGLFDKKEALFKEDINKFGEKVYIKFVFPYLPAMEKLPSGALNETNSFKLKLCNNYRCFYPVLKEKKKFLDGYRLIPFFHPDKHKPEFKTLEKLIQREQKMNEEKSQTRAKTEGAIFSVNTSKQLQERWPEAFEIWKKSNPVKSDQLLPTIPRKEMNKLLGLKTLKE